MIDYSSYIKFIEYDELELKYHEVTNVRTYIYI
jgi:hypothetical protein